MNFVDAVKLAKNKNEQGYSFLYEQTYKKAYYVALKYMANEDRALDVVQDAYVKAFQSIEALEDEEKFPKWLATIVAHTALNELRKDKKLIFVSDTSDDETGENFLESFEDERVDTQPELSLDKKETARLMKEIIDTLSDEQRVCVTMFYMEEMSVKDIAQVLEVSENTVKSRLNYARTKIKDKVLELEKKGTKLYGIAPILFFMLLFREDVQAQEVRILPIDKVISNCNNGVGASTGTGVGNGFKLTAMSIKAKIAIVSIATSVLVAGGIGTYMVINNTAEEVVEDDLDEKEVDEVEIAETEEQFEPYIISSDTSFLEMEVGQIIQLKFDISGGKPDEEPEIKINSNAENIVTVTEDGLVTAISDGTADIILECEDASYIWGVGVVNKAEIVSNQKNISIEPGKMTILSYDLVGGYSYYEKTFTSSDTNVVSVDETGNIIGVNVGNAVVTMKYGDNATYEWNVTVEELFYSARDMADYELAGEYKTENGSRISVSIYSDEYDDSEIGTFSMEEDDGYIAIVNNQYTLVGGSTTYILRLRNIASNNIQFKLETLDGRNCGEYIMTTHYIS